MLYKLAFVLGSGLGLREQKLIIDICQDPSILFSNEKEIISQVPNLKNKIFTKTSKSEALRIAEKELKFAISNNIDIIWHDDERYSNRLRQCEDAPLIIYTKGNCNLNQSKMISIVGSRHATKYGKDFCTKIIAELKERGHNPTIISGLAYGIDITAHREAIKNGLPTIAVLGHSMKELYPPEHKTEAREIIKNGMLISEFSSNIPCLKSLFIQRNRIIAGLSDATIVVESDIKGGSMSTARFAFSYNRDVMCLPGRTSDRMSKGCLHLIKRQNAYLIEDINDIEWIMKWDSPKHKVPNQRNLFADNLSETESRIYNALRTSERRMNLRELEEITHLSVSEILSCTVEMEIKGLITSFPGNSFSC